MQNAKPITNKFYRYADTIVKIKKISKKTNKILALRLDDDSQVIISYQQYELLLKRIYTVGEIAKIVEKRPDTLRKYEKRNLIPEPKKFGDRYKSYQTWRFYEEEDVYEMVEFFNERSPGRPKQTKITMDVKIQLLKEKVKLKATYE